MSLKRIVKLWFIIFVLFMPAQAFSEDKTPYGHNEAVGKFAMVNGIKFYYEIYGKGEPLVLIHGNGDSIAGLSAQIEYFSKKYQVIVADSRGHGKSELGTDHLNYPQMMEDWNELLNQLHVKQTKLLGWSDGGILALLMAISHPDKISKMAIMGANLRPDETAVHSWVKPILDNALKQVDAMIAAQDTSANWGLQKQLLMLLMTQPNIAVQSLRTIKIPVLVMAGDRDVIKGAHTLEIFQNLENAHLAILPGNTHFAPVNDPSTFNALVNDFFAKPFTKPSTQDIMEQH
ncbi:MAG: alpha/beta hydrolase [Emcibacter sp.]|nr:alpha/beta hydrolase [Emcibacter sp.]